MSVANWQAFCLGCVGPGGDWHRTVCSSYLRLRVEPLVEGCHLICKEFCPVGIRVRGRAGEFDDRVQRRILTLQCLIYQVARFVPPDARIELRVIQQLLRRSEHLREASFGLGSKERE